MKRILLTISLLLISLSALTAERIVHVKKTTSSSPNPKPRSVVVKPTVSVDADMCQLTISMVSDDSYTLYVYDNSGRVVYQESVMTDGGRQVYVLPELEADLYTISIEGPSDTYEGEFFAY